jgi:uncharacterized OB-fold protein
MKETEDLEEEMNIDDSQCINCGYPHLPGSHFCDQCEEVIKRENGICEHNNSIPDSDCGCGV